MKILYSTLITLMVLCFSESAFAQNLNDFRSAVDGNWNTVANWQQWDGDSWEVATYYPGNGATGDVTIGNAITANVVVVLPGGLTLSGSLTITTLNFTVAGNTFISGSLVDNSNTGNTTFTGLVWLSGTGTFTTTIVTTAGRMIFENGILQESSGNISVGVANFNTNAQEIVFANNTGSVTFANAVAVNQNLTLRNSGDGTGVGALNFNGTLTIADNYTITNQRTTRVVGALNGATGATNAVWLNDTNSTLEYNNAAAPMTVGTLNAVAANNIVLYNLDADQTIRLTDYYNLSTGTNGGVTNRLKTLQAVAGSMNVSGDVFVGNRTSFLLGTGAKIINVNGDITIETNFSYFRTQNANVVHSLTLGGSIINNGGEFRTYYGALRVCELTFTGSGDLMQGTGTATILNKVTFTSADPKTISYTGNIDFYVGPIANTFTNNNGSLTFTNSTVRFFESFTIEGTGTIDFNNLQCGNNNQTIQTLERDVTVNGTLTLNHSNTANSYFDLKNSTLNVLGNYTRSNSGDFGSTGTSTLNLGNGNTPLITNGLRFETSMNVINLNITNSIAQETALSVNQLNVLNGTYASAQNITINSSLLNNGTFNQTANTTTFAGAATTISTSGGTPSTTFFNVSVAADAQVTNNINVTISNSINGINGFSSWVNNDNSTLNYNGATVPMGTGVFDVDQPNSTVAYSVNGAQAVRATTYTNLIIGGGNTKTLNGNVTVNANLNFSAGTLSIGANTLTLLGDLTGIPIFTGGAASNITIDDAGASPSISIPTVTLGTLTLNRAAGISLGGSVTATNLDLQNGLLTLGGNNLVVTSITGNNSSRYIVADGVGTLRRIVAASDIEFPVGTATSYLPFTLNNAGTSDTYYVNLFNSVTEDGSAGGITVTDNVVNASWVVSEAVAGGSNLTATAQWNLGDEGVDFDRTNSMLAYYNSGSWKKTATSAAAGGNPYTQSRVVGANVGSFSVVDDLFLGVPGLWSGNTSTDWNNPSNWTDYSVPDGTVDVTIPSGRPNYPLLNTAAASCKNLTVANGASLTVNTANFTVNGTAQIEGIFEDNSNTGITTIVGLVTLSGTGTWTSTTVTTVANMVFRNGLTQNSTGGFAAGAATFNTNSQEIQGTGTISFSGAVTLANDIVVTNSTTATISGVLNGSNAASTWFNNNNSVLNYGSATAPMVIGVFDVDQSGSTVNYSGNLAQSVKVTDYYNLVASTGNTKTIASNTSFNVMNNLTVDLGVTLQTINVNGEGVLTVGGIITNNGTLTLRRSNAQYLDLVITSSGNVITGSGSATFANLTLNNVLPKTVDATGIIYLTDGNTVSRANQMVNTGGSFEATQGTFLLNNAATTTYTIAGTGAVTFYNLQSGNNNQSIQILDRNITVNGTLTLNHSNTLSSYLNLNGYTLTVIGGYTRLNTGEFGGNATSSLVLGNGNTPTVSGTINFETGVTTIGTLTHNVVNGVTYYSIGSVLTIENLNVTSGELRSTAALTVANISIGSGTLSTSANLTSTSTWANNGTYTQTANTTLFSNSGGSIAINGSGINQFWTFQIAANTTVTTTNDLFIRQDFINSSDATPAFNATGGSVIFSRAATQYLNGAGTGSVTFNNLTFNASGTKALDLDFTVTGTMSLSATAYAYIWDTQNHSITIKDLIVGDGSAARLYVRDAGVRNHLITITGSVELNSTSYIYLWYSADRYADMVFTGSGNVIKGSGGTYFYVHSLTFTNAGVKNINYSGIIDLLNGNHTPNTFTNNNGLIQASADNTIRFRSNGALWTVDGTGDISFGILEVGANTTTNVRLNRNVSVDENLLFNQSDAAYYLDLNGYQLTLNNNHTRQNNGRIRGGGTSSIVVNGADNFTSTFAFDQTTPGTTNLIDVLDYNRANDGMMQLANLVEINTLNLNQGIINSGAGSIAVNTDANLNDGAFIDNNNGGTNSFLGNLVVAIDASFNPTANSALNFSGNIENHGHFVKDGTGNINFIGNTSILGDSSIYFMNGTVLVNDAITVINNLNTGGIGVYMVGRLNGNGATATWDNRGVLTYFSGNEPMTTGVFTATFNPNTVIYTREFNTQDIKSTTYHHLELISGGLRTMLGNVTVNGDLTIGVENIFYTQEYQLTGNATGTFTMLEASELRIGRDVVASVYGFPGGFVRANIILDPNSLVTFNGQAQPVSAEPIYENVSITNGGGNKTLQGDVTINGYLRMTAGTLAFSTPKRTLTIYGDLLASAGRIDMSGGGLDHELILWGIVNQANRFSNAPNCIVTYASSDNQQVFSPTGGDWYGILEVAGGSTKWLEGTIQIRTELRMTSGIIQLNDFDLNIYSTSPVLTPITGVFSNTNMVETNGTGRLYRQTNANTSAMMQGVYPVGSGGKYSPLTINSITFTGTGTRSLGVRAVPERHPSVLTTYDALLRYWNVSTINFTTLTVANASFEYSALDIIGDDSKYKVYRWTGSEFLEPAGSSIAGSTMLVPNALPLVSEWTAYDNETIRETLYSYKDGSWDDIDTWTTDPAGQLLEGSRIPANSDNIVILAGRTVYLEQDLNTRGLIITIEEGGALDMSTFAFNEVVSVLQGQGTLKLATNQMPLVALNTIVEPEGGTVEYNVPDASFELNNQAYYNNLIINLPGSANVAVLTNNLTIFNDLTVERGKFQIFRDDASATIYPSITLEIEGDILVEAAGSITTGTASTTDGALPATGTTPGRSVPRYYDIYHLVNIQGNLNNNGSVKFVSSDITGFDFQNLTTRGAATVRFFGSDSVDLICNGTTDFYNLVIDKGTGQTSEIIVNASAPENFRLFGCNRYHIPVGGANPELRKALWIRNGTLRLKGMVTIPSLTEGNYLNNQTSYIIPANGALILDDRDVTVLVTADGNNEVTAAWGLPSTGVYYYEAGQNHATELHIYGKMEINEGYISTRFSGGIIFAQVGGELVINGGKLSTRQIRTGWQGNATFTQTGGEVELLGGFQYNTAAIASVNDIINVPIIETHNGYRLDGTGSFNFAYSTNVVNFTGGEMNIYNTSGGGGSRAIRIMADANNVTTTGGEINIFIRRNTNYDFETPYCSLPSLWITKPSTWTVGARLVSPIYVNGDISLDSYGILNANTTNYPVSLTGDFSIGANAAYNPQQNNTTFSGSNPSLFTVDGAITNNLYSLTVDKTGSTLTLAGANGDITTRGDLTISNGTLNDGGKTITATSNIYNSGIHIGTGRILIASGLTNREIGGSGLGEFENVELNEAVDILSVLTANQTVNGTMTMTSGPMDLDIYNLTLNGDLSPNDAGMYSSQTLFVTAGNASDGGLTRTITGNGSYVFPVASRAGFVNRYTPVVTTISGFADDGYIYINPVALELPTLNQNPPIGDALQYYWKVRQSDFSVGPNASWIFTYDDNDVDGDENLYVPGRIETSTRIDEASGVNTTNNTITFPEHAVTRADYTAAKTERFDGAVSVFYNIVSTGGNWDNPNIWSEVGHAGPVSGNIPGAGDIVNIRNSGLNNANHYVWVNINISVAEIIFSYSGAGWGPRLLLNPGVTANMDVVRGSGGQIGFRFNNSGDVPSLNGDISEFSSNISNQILFFPLANSASPVILPSNISVYPSVRIHGPGGNNTGQRIVSFPVDITIAGNLRIDVSSTLRLHNDVTGDVTVYGDVTVGPDSNGGRLEFPTDGYNRTFTVYGNINVGGNASQTGVDSEIRVLNGTPSNLLHELVVHGNITLSRNGKINLFSDNSGGNNVLLTLTNEEDNYFQITEVIGTQYTYLYRVTLDKGSDQTYSFSFNSPFTLNSPTDIATKQIVLQNGSLIVNNSAINIELSSGGGYFQIPATTALVVNQGRVYIDATGTGVNLYGKLRVENTGIIWLGDGTNNYRTILQYQGPNPELEIAGNGILEVNSQIRRPTSTYSGSLRYRQTGGTVNIHGRDPNQGRAKLEVVNTGSEFTMSGGTITIVRGAGTTFGDLYLLPDAGSVTGGEIIFSQGTVNAVQSYIMNTTIPLANLTIAGNVPNNRTATVTLNANPLTVNDLFKMGNSLARFNTNNYNVTMNGDFEFAGIWTYGSTDTTIFTGNAQTITGSPSLNHVKVDNSSLTMQASSVLTANGSLHLLDGTFIDGENEVIVKKDVVNNATFTNSNPANQLTGLKLRGVVNQKVSGTGTFGLIELDNLGGATLQNSISLGNDLILTRGLFNIGSHLLTLGLSSDIVSGSAFSSENMILTDGVFGNNAGIKKSIPAGASSFTFPIGVSGKYTPLALSVSANGTAGSVLVKPVNQYHPTVLDPANVLRYYWYIESDGISNLSADAVMTYVDGDVYGDEANYLGARLFEGNWLKFPGAVNSGSNIITFSFANSSDLLGEYTAGLDAAFSDEILTYTSANSGVWNDPANWVRSDMGVVPASGPSGAKVVILPEHTISTNGNRRSAYSLTLNGRLEAGTSYGHNFGTVDGTGTLSLESNTLPAGKLDAFFSCSGGTMEYGGTTTYNIRNDYPTFRNLSITGTGSIGSPNVANFTICRKLHIKAGAAFRQQRDAFYQGDIELEPSGNYSTLGYSTRLSGTVPQSILGDFTGLNAFKALRFSNEQGYNITNNIDVDNSINLERGRIRNNGYTFSYNSILGILNEVGVNANMYIEGKYRRLLPNNASTHFFPVGKPGFKKTSGIVAPAGASNSFWTVEYIDENPGDNGYNPLLAESPLSQISQSEFWEIEGPNGYTARLRFTLTGTSDVADVVANLNDLRIVRWDGAKWQIVGGIVTITGNKTNGTITCNSNITFNGTTQIFTIGSVQPATAQFTDGTATICAGASTDLEVTFEGVAPFSITYTENGINPVTINGITDNPYVFSVSPLVDTEYELTAMTHAYGNGFILGLPVNVTLRTRPTVTIAADSPICQDDQSEITVTLTSGTAPFSFTYNVDGGLPVTVTDVNSPHIFYSAPLGWSGGDPIPRVYTFTVTSVEDDYGCISDPAHQPDAQVNVYKLPETGPQYHIPNTFGN